MMGVPSEATRLRRFMERVEFEPNTGCWLWTGWLSDYGYGRTIVRGRKEYAHRFAYAQFVGPIPPYDESGIVVMHRCDQPLCVNPEHLRLGSQQDNIADRHIKGRSSRAMGLPGELSPLAKLAEAQVVAIRHRCAAGEAQPIVAADFGISNKTVSKIVRRERWAHI